MKTFSRDSYFILIGMSAAYAVAAILGLKFSALNSFAALMWPPTGIAFAGLLIFGLRFWPAVFVGAFFANSYMGAPVLVAFGIAVGNTLEAVIAVRLCNAGGDFHVLMDRFQDVLRLIVRAAVLSTLVSATFGIGSLWFGGTLPSDQVVRTWLQWWAGNVLSNLTFAPLALLLISDLRSRRWWQTGRRIGEGLLFASATVASSLWVLSNANSAVQYAPFAGLKGIYILFPFLLWGALRFGQRGAVVAVFTISEIAIVFTALQIGPFAGSTDADIFHLLSFVIVVALTGLVVGAIVTERENQRKLAEAASSAKSAFLANMSHEIRTPLGAVLGFSALLSDATTPEKDRHLFVEAIKRNGGLLSNIIDDVLDLSKVEAGKLVMEKSQLPLSEILFDVRILLEPKAKEKNIDLRIFNEAGNEANVETDPLRLQQVLLNVVGNAIKFTERGFVEIRTRLVPGANNRSTLIFDVQDTGPGISKDLAQKLFSPFTQADASSTRRFGGTGLGLSLSRKIAQALGGDVVLAESGPDRGSTFTITIDVSPTSPGQAETRELSKTEAPLSLQGLKILLVDDSVDNQRLVEMFLDRAGASVESANNGRQAVDSVRSLQNSFDVILMDLQMPEMDGYEAAREIRKLGFHKPIFALTAHAMPKERKKSLESGFDHHISKPIDHRQLLHLLSEVRQKRQSSQKNSV